MISSRVQVLSFLLLGPRQYDLWPCTSESWYWVSQSVGSQNILEATPMPGQQAVLSQCMEEHVSSVITSTEHRLNVSPVQLLFSWSPQCLCFPSATWCQGRKWGEVERQQSWWLQLKFLTLQMLQNHMTLWTHWKGCAAEGPWTFPSFSSW